MSIAGFGPLSTAAATDEHTEAAPVVHAQSSSYQLDGFELHYLPAGLGGYGVQASSSADKRGNRVSEIAWMQGPGTVYGKVTVIRTDGEQELADIRDTHYAHLNPDSLEQVTVGEHEGFLSEQTGDLFWRYDAETVIKAYLQPETWDTAELTELAAGVTQREAQQDDDGSGGEPEEEPDTEPEEPEAESDEEPENEPEEPEEPEEHEVEEPKEPEEPADSTNPDEPEQPDAPNAPDAPDETDETDADLDDATDPEPQEPDDATDTADAEGTGEPTEPDADSDLDEEDAFEEQFADCVEDVLDDMEELEMITGDAPEAEELASAVDECVIELDLDEAPSEFADLVAEAENASTDETDASPAADEADETDQTTETAEAEADSTADEEQQSTTSTQRPALWHLLPRL